MTMEMGLVGNFNRYFKEDSPSGQASSGHSYLFKGLVKYFPTDPYCWGRPGSWGAFFYLLFSSDFGLILLFYI